ncbi:MAG TPA: nicotinamidase, partial [Chloroflexi bacterium]|nr:nicotinamidase [Chloroflexota bacterium]
MAMAEGTMLAERATPYLNYIEGWLRQLPSAALTEIITSAGGPERVAIVSVDLIVG